tara:strand:+ start:2941 stop:3963 length:1023 start_codon:yes stop_codon:yes gene_type:complete
MKRAYSFDDVLLKPKYSDLTSRTQVDLSSKLTKNITLSLPVISSPMDTVTESSMAMAMDQRGALGIIHRYNTIKEQVALVHTAKSAGAKNVGAAIGVTGDYLDRATALYDAGAKIICVDIAHGHHVMMRRSLYELRDIFASSVHIMAGNVATLEAFEDLVIWGADSIRVGIGGGSICSTRLVTGHGVPTLQSILDVSKTTSDVKIIADGGIKTTGDMIKAIAAGADFVMVGSMLAGTDETPGEVLCDANTEKYKVYRGMASSAAQRSWRGRSSTPEGISATVPYRGVVSDILKDIDGGLRSGLSYTGAKTISEFQVKAEFLHQTPGGLAESNTHILRRHK